VAMDAAYVATSRRLCCLQQLRCAQRGEGAVAQPCSYSYSTVCKAPPPRRRSWPRIWRRMQRSPTRRRQPLSRHLRRERGRG
jgi:hypothetical protein